MPQNRIGHASWNPTAHRIREPALPEAVDRCDPGSGMLLPHVPILASRPMHSVLMRDRLYWRQATPLHYPDRKSPAGGLLSLDSDESIGHGCRACERIEDARFASAFDANGKFLASTLPEDQWRKKRQRKHPLKKITYGIPNFRTM